MKEEIATRTKLELRIVKGPCSINCRDTTIKLDERDDAGCLVLMTMSDRTILSEEIIAVTLDTRTFLRLRAFALVDGAITLHPNLG